MGNILTLIAIASAFLIALIAGFFIGLYLVCIIESDDDQECEEYLHCFECEIEMPVKEKNGRRYCSNCGLYHDAFQ